MEYFGGKRVGVLGTPEHRSPEEDHNRRSRGTRGTRSVTPGTEYFRGKRCRNV
jgi:hypothetical protein